MPGYRALDNDKAHKFTRSVIKPLVVAMESLPSSNLEVQREVQYPDWRAAAEVAGVLMEQGVYDFSPEFWAAAAFRYDLMLMDELWQARFLPEDPRKVRNAVRRELSVVRKHYAKSVRIQKSCWKIGS